MGVSVAAALSTRRSEETTTSRRIHSPSSQRARLRPGYSGTASSSRRLSKPTSHSSKRPTLPPMTIGTSPATASRTSTASTSTPGRSRRARRERDRGWKALSSVGLFWLHRDRIAKRASSGVHRVHYMHVHCDNNPFRSCETQEMACEVKCKRHLSVMKVTSPSFHCSLLLPVLI